VGELRKEVCVGEGLIDWEAQGKIPELKLIV
jgi:hypothetical protein